MNKYTIKITGNNPEYPVTETLEEGRGADGYLLLMFEDGKLAVTNITDISTMDLAEALCRKDDVINILEQATAIAEGFRKANRIRRARAGLGVLRDINREEG